MEGVESDLTTFLKLSNLNSTLNYREGRFDNFLKVVKSKFNSKLE